MGVDIIITGTPLPEFIQQIISGLSPQLRTIVKEEIQQSTQNSLEEKYISEKEARKILPVTAPTFRSYRSQGLFPSYRVGGRIFYKPSEIMEAAKRIRKYDRDKQVA
jgi:hypothetical protein